MSKLLRSIKTTFIVPVLISVITPFVQAQLLPVSAEFEIGHQLFQATDASRNRQLPIDIWYPATTTHGTQLASYPYIDGFEFPSENAFEAATIAESDAFPLVIFSPGSWGVAGFYHRFAETLAMHGFVVAGITHTGNTPDEFSSQPGSENQSARDRPRDISFVIDEMLNKASDSSDSFFGRIDSDRIGVAGHSFGAVASFTSSGGYSSYGLEPDERIKAIMPVSSGSGRSDVSTSSLRSSVPTLLIDGTRDFRVGSGLFRQMEREFERNGTIEGDRYLVDIQDAVHTSYFEKCTLEQYATENSASGRVLAFVDTSIFGECNPSVIDNELATQITELYAVSFFKSYVAEDADFRPFLTEEYALNANLPLDFKAIVVPEPSSCSLFVVGVGLFLNSRRLRYVDRKS